MNRLRALVVMASVSVFAPMSAAAAPVTLTFSGQWGFFDPVSDAPEFHAAMAALGIVGSTPLSLTLTLADTALSPSGTYPGALLGGQFTLGSISYTLEPGAFGLSQSCVGFGCTGTTHFFTHFSGPIPAFGARTFFPNFIQFDSNVSFALSNSLPSSLSSAAWQNPFIFVSFWNQPVVPPKFGSQGDMGVSALRFESARVPEPATLALALIGLAASAFGRRRRRG